MHTPSCLLKLPPYNREEKIPCKKRWTGKDPVHILAMEFKIALVAVPYVAFRHEATQIQVAVWRPKLSSLLSKVMQPCDTFLITKLHHEPSVHVDVLPSVIYEDSFFLVCYKPHGLPTVPQGAYVKTNLFSMMITNRNSLHLLNRLDRCTAGIVIFAKSSEVYNSTRVIEKNYIAQTQFQLKSDLVSRENILVQKHVPNQPLKAIISSSEGKVAVTRFSPLSGKFVLCQPLDTGRTHQIRVHLASAGHPIQGDFLYDGSAEEPSAQPERIDLFSYKYIVNFQGSILSFKSPLPSWLKSVDLSSIESF
jgi:23S rRNA-/tRNA-specific pseudouridylate synthase